ncbi:hypothetical protein IP92_05222 [Pseudoduganella flava]|uniref:Uncharacterized protein n=1 Tax=Pseudoduganella flava TaxID=871742 RepID=A0A562PER6_9BURK|nr:hypothetical protein IP92_05222 [Pseudoduganella flava]
MAQPVSTVGSTPKSDTNPTVRMAEAVSKNRVDPKVDTASAAWDWLSRQYGRSNTSTSAASA